jgi:hypothetical protein
MLQFRLTKQAAKRLRRRRIISIIRMPAMLQINNLGQSIRFIVFLSG